MSTNNTVDADPSAPNEVQGASGDRHQDVVSIKINNKPYPIHRGRQKVVEIKQVGGVPQADELAQVIEGNTPPLTPLPDDGAVTIKGGEEFISYPRDSGSSCCKPCNTSPGHGTSCSVRNR